MIQLTPQMRILVAIEPADFRNYAVTEVMRSWQRLPSANWSLKASGVRNVDG